MFKKILKKFSFLILAFMSFLAVNTFVVNAINVTAADAIPTQEQLSSIGFSFYNNYAIVFTGTKNKLNGGNCKSTIAVLQDENNRYYLSSGDNVSFELNKLNKVTHATINPGYSSSNILAWSNYEFEFYSPQSIDDLNIDSQGRIYYEIRNAFYGATQKIGTRFYLGLTGYTSDPDTALKINLVKEVDKPTLSPNTFAYTGKSISTGIETCDEYTVSNDVSATNVGTYSLTCTLNEGYKWSDDSTEQISIEWKITKASTTIVFENSTLEIDGISNTEYLNQVTVSNAGTLSFSSSDTTVATVNQSSGKVIVLKSGTVTITATYSGDNNYSSSSNSYTLIVKSEVKFTYNDGSDDYSREYILTGATMPSIAVPTKEGYTFEGYFDQVSGGKKYYSADGSSAVTSWDKTSNTNLFAQWTIKQYTLTFESNGGTSINSIAQNFGTDLSIPTTSKLGYTFDGWYSDIGLQTQFTSTTMPASDKKLYAKWSIAGYEITYNLDDGVNHASNPNTYTIESALITLQEPTKHGYTFSGWSNNGVIAAGSTGVQTFTAYWIPTPYDITYNLGGGLNHTINPSSYTIESALITLQEPTKSGYTFNGWSNNGVIATGSTGVQTFTASWVENSYTISFDSNGGSKVSNVTEKFNSSVTAPVNPIKNGFTFIDWYFDNNTFVNAYIFSVMPAEDVTLYAKWNANTYTITFDTLGGSTINSISQNVGTNLIAPVSPIREGYMFIGWYSDDTLINKYIFSTMPSKNFTVYARWEESNSNNTTFKVEFKTNTSISISTQNINAGGHVIRPNNPSKNGYIFLGWYSNSSMTRLWNFDTDVVNSDTTLYAKHVAEVYNLSGTVYSEDGKVVKNAVIIVKAGTKYVIETETDNQGYYGFNNIPNGVYNIVALTKDGYVQTNLASIYNNNVVRDIILVGYRLNTIIEIDEKLPEIVVDGLEDIVFGEGSIVSVGEIDAVKNGGTIDVKVVMLNNSSASDSQEYIDIRINANKSNRKLTDLFDLSMYVFLTKADGNEVNTRITEVNSLLTVYIPLSNELLNGHNYVIYRYHDGQVEEISSTINQYGEYLELSEDGSSLILHTKRFSSYAIGFSQGKSHNHIWWILIVALLHVGLLVLLACFVKRQIIDVLTTLVYGLITFISLFFIKDWICFILVLLALIILAASIIYIMRYRKEGFDEVKGKTKSFWEKMKVTIQKNKFLKKLRLKFKRKEM